MKSVSIALINIFLIQNLKVKIKKKAALQNRTALL